MDGPGAPVTVPVPVALALARSLVTTQNGAFFFLSAANLNFLQLIFDVRLRRDFSPSARSC